MKYSWRWCVFSVCLMLTALSARAGELDESQFMPVDQVKAGMIGVGRTVFSGTQIEEFQVQILGVLKNARPKGDIILARVSGGPLAEAGVIQGMSGSPVYIEGRLVGAMSLAWGFSKEPICGITPIGEMLQLWRQMDEDQGVGEEDLGASGFPNAPQLFEERMTFPQSPQGNQADEPWQDATRNIGLVPLKTPVMLSGFDELVVAQMAPVLEQYNLVPIQAGAAADEELETPLEPGASVAGQMVRGDVSFSAVGTLTHREGDRVLAFGHPMFSAGGINVPLSGAYVHSILPSQMISFKLASATKQVGALRQDRRSGIAGVIGQEPLLIPVHMSIHYAGESQEESFFFEIIDSKFFSPNLVTWTTLNALLTSGKAVGDVTMQMDARIVMEGYPELRLRNIFAGASPHIILATELGDIIGFLLRNNLETVTLKDMNLDISVENRRRVAAISSARLDKKIVRPGEEVHVTAFLQPYRGEERIVRTSIRVPDDAPSGNMMIQISDAASSISWEQKRAPHRFQFHELAQVLDMLSGLERNDQLIVKLVTARRGAIIKGRELPSLPPSALATLRGSQGGSEGGLTREEVLVEERLDTEFVLGGQIALPLTVRR